MHEQVDMTGPIASVVFPSLPFLDLYFRLTVVDEEQPLDEPLLPTHGGGYPPRSGFARMAKTNPPPNRTAGGRAGRVAAGQGAGGEGAGNDSFVYQIVRSQRERTETTI